MRRALLVAAMACGYGAALPAEEPPGVPESPSGNPPQSQSTAAPRSPAKPRRLANRGTQPADSRSEQGPAVSLQDIPAPASDPSWPTWQATDNSDRQPIQPPVGFYSLIRPPFGVAPQETGQEYQRLVASEADLDFNAATCPQPIDIYRPDGIAPSGVIGDHTLNTLGRVMVSYRFNDVAFDGLRNGTSNVSTASALSQFPIVPTSGTAQNQLIMLEYGITDDLTFQGILPVIQRHFNYVDAVGNHYVNDLTDLSDIQLYALYVIGRSENQQVHLNVGVQIPTGILIEQGNTTSPTSPALTYPVRSSDGTWDFLPGITYRGQSENWTWGLQGLGIVRFGINRYDYRLGDEGDFNGWISRRLSDSFSLSTRLNAHVTGNISGADPQLNPALLPSNQPGLQASQQINILFGMNYVIPDGFLKGQRVGIEGGLPVYQWLAGPELRQQYILWANLNILF